MAILLALTGLLILSTKQASRFANVIVAFKVGTVLFFVGLGIFVQPENRVPWVPWIPIATAVPVCRARHAAAALDDRCGS